ncbi:DUF7218 family protein [Roseobacter weihaiensis]|uniref:DUF7218 family protein n=1 Tax=Roseobacter weihaiensis TaxID=2763262 RepID=UPI001D0AD7E8|nr:Rho termination factor N-terminal domain-containing protein [Roseobacter sp. H9]
MSESHGNSIKNSDTYEALRGKGASKQKAAAIANAQARDDMEPSKKGGAQPPYEDWTRKALYQRAQELEIEGRSDMTKAALIAALRKA